MNTPTARFWRMLPKLAFLAMTAAALSGCVVVPLYPYHPRYAYYR